MCCGAFALCGRIGEREVATVEIADMDALREYLRQAQMSRYTAVRCELTPELSARVTDAGLVEALIMGLPMAQGVQHRIVRSRGRGALLTAKIRYREGVRMLDRWRNGRKLVLTDDEFFGLAKACDIAMDAICLERAELRFERVYSWICQNIRYVHTAPGQKGYERLVGAASVIRDRQANCQGFADLLYLLCGICGIDCEIRCGRGEKRLHVWNAVCLNGTWLDVDASKGAREQNS